MISRMIVRPLRICQISPHLAEACYILPDLPISRQISPSRPIACRISPNLAKRQIFSSPRNLWQIAYCPILPNVAKFSHVCLIFGNCANRIVFTKSSVHNLGNVAKSYQSMSNRVKSFHISQRLAKCYGTTQIPAGRP